MGELNPCPFCGDDRDDHNPDCYLDLCNRMGRGETFTPSVMEAAWNRRAPHPDASAEGWEDDVEVIASKLEEWAWQYDAQPTSLNRNIAEEAAALLRRLAPKAGDGFVWLRQYDVTTVEAAKAAGMDMVSFLAKLQREPGWECPLFIGSTPSAPVAGSDATQLLRDALPSVMTVESYVGNTKEGRLSDRIASYLENDAALEAKP